MVAPQEDLLIAAVGCHRTACKTEEPLRNVLVVHVFPVFQRIQIAVDSLTDAVAQKNSPGNEQGILKIYLILLIVGVVGKLGVTGHSEIPDVVRGVGQLQIPDLVGLVQGNVV